MDFFPRPSTLKRNEVDDALVYMHTEHFFNTSDPLQEPTPEPRGIGSDLVRRRPKFEPIYMCSNPVEEALDAEAPDECNDKDDALGSSANTVLLSMDDFFDDLAMNSDDTPGFLPDLVCLPSRDEDSPLPDGSCDSARSALRPLSHHVFTIPESDSQDPYQTTDGSRSSRSARSQRTCRSDDPYRTDGSLSPARSQRRQLEADLQQEEDDLQLEKRL